MNGSGALWSCLARLDDYEWYISHTAVFKHLARVHSSSSNVTKETTAALKHFEAVLRKFCVDFASLGFDPEGRV